MSFIFKLILSLFLHYQIFLLINCENRFVSYFGFAVPRRLMWDVLSTSRIFEATKKMGKVQHYEKNSTDFFCSVKNGPGTRSKIRPTSINQLRPGDIDIIATMGDSLSAGSGSFSRFAADVLREYRSIAFSGGGRANWRKYLTLPNILKEFNPNLYGYAVGDGLTVDHVSRLNIAEPMLMSEDLTFNAKALVQRMIANPNVNMEKHWKLLTIFVGNLDFCIDSCHFSSTTKWVASLERNFVKALRILRDNIPRLFINLISLPKLTILRKLKDCTMTCYVTHRAYCPCLMKPNITKKGENDLEKMIEVWHNKEIEISKREEFQKQDFAIVVQPIFNDFSYKITSHGTQDLRFFSTDCFHFSQLGHAQAAIGIWNNLIQPIGFKSNNVFANSNEFLCPSEDYPYIATHKNSHSIWKANFSETAKIVLPRMIPSA